MASDPLTAHSLAEAELFLQAAACPRCGKGPLRALGLPKDDPDGGSGRIVLTALCHSCERQPSLRFKIATGPPTANGDPPPINPTPEPSELLDAGQWITLYQSFIHQADKEPNRSEARRLRLRAAQCLDEALKFYRAPDDDLPPADALFHPASRERFREHPQRFSRQRLLDLRARLPVPSSRRPSTGSGQTGE